MQIINMLIVMPFLIFGLFSCSTKHTNDSNTLTVAIGSKPSTLDPRFATDANGMRISVLLFNSLVRIGSDLKVQGDAAKSWSYESLIYTFDLHPGLKFSNGRMLTAEDIYFSFSQFRADNNIFHSALEVIKKIEVNKISGYFQVKIHLKKFSAKFLTSDLPIVKLLPKQEVLALGDDFQKKLIGTGSYKFIKQNANEIHLEARLKHEFMAPKIKNLIFKIIRDEFTRYQKTLKGSIDINQAELPLAKVIEFEKKPKQFQVYKYPGLSMSYLLVNLKDPLLKNKKLRQAIAHAINRKEIIKYKLEGFGQPATSILTPNNPFFNKDIENLEFSIEKAKKIISDMGLLESEIILKTSNAQSTVEKGRVLVQQLQSIGIKVKMQSFEWGTYYGDVKKGRFQLATMRWIGALDPDIYRISLHSNEKPPGRNRGEFENARLDQLVMEGLSISNLKKRIKHYKEVQKIVLEELPIIPLWYDEQVSVVNKRIKDYVPPLNGEFRAFIKVSK